MSIIRKKVFESLFIYYLDISVKVYSIYFQEASMNLYISFLHSHDYNNKKSYKNVFIWQRYAHLGVNHLLICHQSKHKSRWRRSAIKEVNDRALICNIKNTFYIIILYLDLKKPYCKKNVLLTPPLKNNLTSFGF